MKLISWNVNGLRACIGKGFLDFVNFIDADVICLQETKLQPHHLMAELRFLAGGLDSGEISLSSVFLDCPKVVIELL